MSNGHGHRFSRKAVQVHRDTAAAVKHRNPNLPFTILKLDTERQRMRKEWEIFLDLPLKYKENKNDSSLCQPI